MSEADYELLKLGTAICFSSFVLLAFFHRASSLPRFAL
jgi:hypothetical protein